MNDAINTTHGAQNAPLLNAAQLAGVLGLAPETIRRAARLGAIPCLRAGGVIRFNADHVATITRDGFAWPEKTAQGVIKE